MYLASNLLRVTIRYVLDKQTLGDIKELFP